MISLAQQIIAYLSVNNITYQNSDWYTGQPDGRPDAIIYWNTAVLGTEPTQTQLDESYPIYEGQQIAAQNKATATSLLSQTDWTATVDINNPQYSNPYLMNQDAFLNYRSQVRQIAVNPPTIPAIFPNQPQEVWSS